VLSLVNSFYYPVIFISNAGAIGMDVRLAGISIFTELQYYSVGLCCSQLAAQFSVTSEAGTVWDGTVELVLSTFLFINTGSQATYNLQFQTGISRMMEDVNFLLLCLHFVLFAFDA
jgi:hypothetical protein